MQFEPPQLSEEVEPLSGFFEYVLGVKSPGEVLSNLYKEVFENGDPLHIFSVDLQWGVSTDLPFPKVHVCFLLKMDNREFFTQQFLLALIL